jgi:glycosyltransferase involved in cell wall biosynthesis
MRIVVVTPSCPHPFKNAAARWYYALLVRLSRLGHSVVCLTGGEDDEETVDETGAYLTGSAVEFRHHPLRDRQSAMMRKARSLISPGCRMLGNHGLVRDLDRELSRGYDVLHLEQLWTGCLGFGRPRALLNVHHFEIIDIEHHHPGWRMWKEYTQMRRGTARILKQFEYVRVMTPRLEQKARSINSAARYWTVPICLDLDLYEMQPPVEEPIVGLLGSMHWYPTRSAAKRLIEDIWPLVHKKRPDARLFIAGWNARKFLGHLLPRPGVRLEENLGSPTDFFSRAAVMVYAPARGKGMKVKNLEAMAYGVPVVTTWEGVEGMTYTNGLHCFVEETNERLAEKVLELLGRRETRMRLRVEARRLMEEKYSPRPTVAAVEEIHRQIAAGKSAGERLGKVG